MRRLTESDLEDAGRIMARAFHEDPFYRLLFPDAATRASVLPTYFQISTRTSLRMGTAYGVAERSNSATSVAPDSGTAIANATAYQVAALFGPSAHEAYAHVMDYLSANRAELAPSSHWYLNLVAVAPAAQGAGLGRALLDPVLAEADRDGRACCLETFASENLRWYERLGFEPARSGTVSSTGLSWWTMLRPPAPPQIPRKPRSTATSASAPRDTRAASSTR